LFWSTIVTGSPAKSPLPRRMLRKPCWYPIATASLHPLRNLAQKLVRARHRRKTPRADSAKKRKLGTPGGAHADGPSRTAANPKRAQPGQRVYQIAIQLRPALAHAPSRRANLCSTRSLGWARYWPRCGIQFASVREAIALRVDHRSVAGANRRQMPYSTVNRQRAVEEVWGKPENRRVRPDDWRRTTRGEFVSSPPAPPPAPWESATDPKSLPGAAAAENTLRVDAKRIG